jgi:hypothetical protein
MTDQITLKIDTEAADEIVAAWLRLRLEWLYENAQTLTHDEDKEDNAKDAEAMRRVLNFITGEHPDHRKLLCAREAWSQWMDHEDIAGEGYVGLRAIELWEEGFGK